MSLMTGIYQVIIRPLQLLFEFIFAISCRLTYSPGFSIIMMSLLINILLLPFYKRADQIQAEENELEKKMKRGVAHIKKTFHGDERFMMLQTYYRQNNYKPGYALRGLLPLMLEIPFFIAAYNFLSGLTLLNGAAYGIISDLGAPDRLINIFGMTFNLLPILMTIINIVSSAIYTREASLKTKIQLYAMALVFFVFLYNSPSGLVFYWTLNNLFSLIKNVIVVYREKHVKKAEDKVKACKIRNFIRKIRRKNGKIERVSPKYLGRYFLTGAFFMTVLCGLLIPSSVINSSPEEFMKAGSKLGPSFFILNNFLVAFGTFILWLGIFYLLSGEKGRRRISSAIWIVSGISTINYLFFATKMGNLSPTLQYDLNMDFDPYIIVFNTIIVLVLTIILILIFKKKTKLVPVVYSAALLAIIIMSFTNVSGIKGIVKGVKATKNDKAYISLSKKGKNVVILMMDRAMGAQLPYIFKEKPNLKSHFTGFTYYPNCSSFGGHTNYASPPLFGGYEYTPERMNARDQEKLMDKHHEALKVLPRLFNENGYKVTVCDPPYAGYRWVSDLSVYNDLKGVKTYITEGKFNIGKDHGKVHHRSGGRERNFIFYSYMKCAPLLIQPIIYDDGLYNDAEFSINSSGAGVQISTSTKRASGFNKRFMNAYSVLVNFSNITKITDDEVGNFFVIDNNTPHEPTILQKPDYKPKDVTDNTEYDRKHPNDYIIDGREMKMENGNQVAHYHVNVASYLELAKWFDYLKKEGVYDNTRIIIVSDHGRGIGQFKDQLLPNGFDTGWFRPLLMVKDFNKKGFEIDRQFMTNADVPNLATKNLIKDARNPYTGQLLDQDYKKEPQKIMFTNYWNVNINNGTKFLPAEWFTVHTDINDMNNWKYLGTH